MNETQLNILQQLRDQLALSQSASYTGLQAMFLDKSVRKRYKESYDKVTNQIAALDAALEVLTPKPIIVCECPTGIRNITDGGHFPACTACKRRIK